MIDDYLYKVKKDKAKKVEKFSFKVSIIEIVRR